MVLHPSIHFEIARLRQRDLVAEAEHRRIAAAFDDAPITSTGRSRLRPASASRSAIEAGLEV
jgi:hypothetical protein